MYKLCLKSEHPVLTPIVPLAAARLVPGNRNESPHARFVFKMDNAATLSRLLQVMRCLSATPILDLSYNGLVMTLGLAVVLRVDESGAARVLGNGSHLFAAVNDIVLKVSAQLSPEDEDVYLARASSKTVFTVVSLELADSCGHELQLWAGEAPLVVLAPQDMR